MKHNVLVIILTFATVFLFGCKEDTYAPDVLKVGDQIYFKGYLTVDGDNTKYGEDGYTLTITSDTKCKLNLQGTSGHYTYQKTGERTATLDFVLMQYFPSNTRRIHYMTELTFKSDKEFSMVGTKRLDSSLQGSHSCNIFCEGNITHD